MVVVFAAERLPMANKGKNTARRPAGGGGAFCGTIIGFVARDFRSRLSDPTRITPALKFALARSIVKPVFVKVANGAVVPVLVQSTCRRARTDNSALTVNALKLGGAEPKGVVMPSTHRGLPATTPAGIARLPVFTEKLAGVTAAAPLPVKS